MATLSDATLDLIQSHLNLSLTDVQVEQFTQYRSLLMSWNTKLNLTAVRTELGIESVHFVDSLTLAPQIRAFDGQSLIDVGTGAGFPGIPLKIVFPSLQLTLVESIRKKANFLGEVVRELGLTDVTILAERAEVVGRDLKHREQYDWVVARAVAELNILLEYLVPFCRPNGRILAMKGPETPNELAAASNAVEELGLQIESSEKVSEEISGDKQRFLVLVARKGPLSERYPRRAGIPTKRPLR
ncbi:MAG: 16S rRNA (guanine(527)-N(7))-methyltransferase RsmG [Chloroflexota bacterium]